MLPFAVNTMAWELDADEMDVHSIDPIERVACPLMSVNLSMGVFVYVIVTTNVSSITARDSVS
jgi:hypothetical protein